MKNNYSSLNFMPDSIIYNITMILTTDKIGGSALSYAGKKFQ